MTNIRGHLAAAVLPSDQILLLGPPYKVPKDATLQSEETLNALRLGDAEDNPIQEESDSLNSILSSTERSGARRLFLFSKQLLSQNAPEPPICQLKPPKLDLPTEAPGPSPLNMDPATSPPLHQALAAYERQFTLYTTQGRVLADGADLRYSACRTCVQELAVMARALRAAVSNLSDHFHGASRTRAELTGAFQAKTSAHASLLQRFDTIMQELSHIQLHPALVSVARSCGRPMETLLDTVPVERERAWAHQCQTSHQRLISLFSELNTAFEGLGTSATREEDTMGDQNAENEVEVLWNEVETTARAIRDRQTTRLEQLTTAHRNVIEVIVNAINTGNDDEVQAAFTPLREQSDASKNTIPDMLQDDSSILSLMEKVANAKTRAMKRMRDRLRAVSVSQSLIQRVLSSVGVIRDALSQQVDNMVHLEHVAELPQAYRDFLAELRRRRAYGNVVSSTSTAMMEKLAGIRDDEVKSREKFLRGSGRHLMPAFFEIFAPTLGTPPPLFTPQLSMVETDGLPDVGGDLADTVMHSATADHTGVSSASTLTAESNQIRASTQGLQSMAIASQEQVKSLEHQLETQVNTMLSQSRSKEPQQQDQLIVSAEDPSATDLIVGSEGAEADAEAKKLAYENAVLRQALENAGGKSPQNHIDEANARSEGSSKILRLEKELAEARGKAKSATEALEVASAESKLDDKISHSSFSVGDVGLFMPMGRGSGGKRLYVAFHTSCPRRFLSTDCVKGAPDFIVGRIVYQEELVAGETGTDANPYGVGAGQTFWVLTVEVLHPNPQK